MAKYRPFLCSFWEDPDIEKFKPLEKLVYSYLFTNHLATESGIYAVSHKYISERTGININNINNIIKTLETTYQKITCDINNIIFVHGFFRRNGRGSPKLLEKSIISDMKNYPSMKCWTKFLEIYSNHCICIKIKEVLNTCQDFVKTSLELELELEDSSLNHNSEEEESEGKQKPLWMQNTEEGFAEYLKMSEPAFDALYNDWSWIAGQREYYPGASIRRSLMKSWEQFWGTKAGWKNKRDAARGNPDYQPDWKLTVERTIKLNICYFGKGEIDDEKAYIERLKSEKKS